MSISIRWIMTIFIAFVAATTGLVSFLPTYFAGVSAVRETVTDIREGIVNQLIARVDGFFSAPQYALAPVRAMIETDRLIPETEDKWALLNLACRIMYSDPNGYLNTMFFLMPHLNPEGPTVPTYIHCDRRFGTPRGGSVNTSGFNMYDLNGSTYYPLDLNKLYLNLDFNKAFFLGKEIYQTLESNFSKRWSQPYVGYDSLQLSAAFPFHMQNGVDVGVVSLDILPKIVSGFLTQVGLRENGRALIAHTESQIVLGSSWGERPEILLAPWLDMTLPDNQRMIFKRIGEFGDSLINEVIAHLGGPTAVFSLPTPHKDTMGSGKDAVLVDLHTFIDPYELNLKILIAMPEKDFLGEVYTTQQTVIIIFVVCFVMMVVIGFIFALRVQYPLERIGDRMHATASLQDEGGDETDNLSLIAEVEDIQVSYELMKSELNRMRSFLPESVLRGMAGDDDDDDGPVDLASENSEGSLEKNTSGRNGDSMSIRSGTSQSSRLSRSTTHSSSFGGVGAVRGPLNTRMGHMSQKRVAVLCMNLSEFHERVRKATTSSVGTMQQTFLKVAMKNIRDNRGVVDAFQGDHVIVSFNAVAAVPSYTRRAITAAYETVREVASHPELPFLRAGVAVGNAVVGNSGTPDLQRFNIIGGVYSMAHSLMSLGGKKANKPYFNDAALLVTQQVVQDIETEFYVQWVDSVISNRSERVAIGSVECYIDRSKNQKLTKKCELLRETGTAMVRVPSNGNLLNTSAQPNLNQSSGLNQSSAAHAAEEEDNEWMYVLADGKNNDPFHKINAVFEQLHSSGCSVERLEELLAEAEAFEAEKKPHLPLASTGIRSIRAIIKSCSSNSEKLREYDGFARTPIM